MIKVDNTKNISGTKPKNLSKEETNRTKFKGIEKQESKKISSTSSSTSINPLLLLQEADNEYQKEQKKLKRQGNNILHYLNKMRLSLLTGSLSENQLLQLKEELSQGDYQFSTPVLQEVINDIVLRAEVEIAKIETNRQE